MTPREADKLIKAGEKVTLYDPFYNETMTIIISGRDRYNLFTSEGGVFSRDGLEIVKGDQEKAK